MPRTDTKATLIGPLNGVCYNAASARYTWSEGESMRYLILVLKGVAYGLTHIVPGIGGALVLILLGVYEQFVDAVGNFFVRRDRWKEYIPFLACLGLGMVIGLLAFARLLTALLERFPIATMFFFMGLLVGSIPYIFRMHADMRATPGRIVALVFGLSTVVGMRVLEHLEIRSGALMDIETLGGLVYHTLSSFAAGGASVTPGMDGSYVFLVAGIYAPIMEALSKLTHLVIDWRTLIATSVGSAAGIVIFSKLIDTAIRRVPSVTYYCVLGLLAGSVYALWPEGAAVADIPVGIITFAAGAALALFFSRPVPEDHAVVEQSA
ncbi:MAG: DUF368 domain-containing protein [Anaerolineae bacterium]